MNLKEAKEQLEKNGYKVQKLNECGFSSGCGSSGCGGYVGAGSYRNNRSTSDSTTLADIISKARQDAAASRRISDDETLKNLLAQIPPEKKALLIQLLQALIK